MTPWLTLDADLAFTQARFTDNDRAGNQVPGALDRVLAAGLTLDGPPPFWQHPWAALRPSAVERKRLV